MKRKGFTLIELLAVIIILAIIALIATPRIIELVDKAKESSFERQKEFILDAAKMYTFKNPNVKELGYVTLRELIDNNYIESGIKDNKGNVLDDIYIVNLESNHVVTTTKTEGEVININNSIGLPLNKLIISGKSDQTIPSGYTFYDYIRITNDSDNGYHNSINTGIPFNTANKIEFKYKSTDTLSNILFMCGYVSSTSKAAPYIAASVGSNVTTNSFTNSTLTPNNITRGQASDGTIKSFILDYTSSNTNSISFGSWSDISWSRTIDWYSFKIWNNGTLLRNFIPAKRNSDNILGMYDLVNNVFYTNAGTGAFTAGSEIILPSPDIPIEIKSVSNFDLVSRTPNILNNGNFTNGTTSWTATTGSLSVNNKILKLTASSIPTVVIQSDTNEPCIVGNKYFLRARVRRLDGNSLIDIRLRGTTSATNSVVAKNINSFVVGEWQYIFGIATVTSELTGNIRFGIYINNIANGQVEVDGNYGVMLIPMGKDASHSLFLKTENEMNTLFSNYIDKKENIINFPYTLRSLPDGTKDYIEIDNVKKTAKLYKNIENIVLTGTEVWNKNADKGNFISFFLSKTAHGIIQGTTVQMCSHAPFMNWNPPSGNYWWNASSSVGMRLHKSFISDYDNLTTDYQRVLAFKTWLTSQYNAGTPVTVQYKLATPEIINLDYDKYKNIVTYKGFTNIYKTGIKSNMEIEIFINEKNKLI
ncbi:MAG: prepilin-type N-terminal cleavage/methylation domain-containing protein [Bacilli bacterium]|nr:prepilin-type N-terminal cleavage/methylation domain-containing protein [Bacilli bacterium]MDD4733314.1 prepilin-type N-terminal cleavage/methylation domain-containing protein [Bacilli bacterium]